jgi:hypothetical protein
MRYLPLLSALLLLAACTTTKPLPGSFDDAEEAINAAVSAGAEEYSPVELKFAREKLVDAHEALASKEYDQSIYLIEQSQINSELAIEKSRAAEVRNRVTEAVRENEILREDFENTFGEAFE